MTPEYTTAPSAGPELLSIDGVCELADISRREYYDEIHPAIGAGQIMAVYFGRTPRIFRASLLTWLVRRADIQQRGGR